MFRARQAGGVTNLVRPSATAWCVRNLSFDRSGPKPARAKNSRRPKDFYGKRTNIPLLDQTRDDHRRLWCRYTLLRRGARQHQGRNDGQDDYSGGNDGGRLRAVDVHGAGWPNSPARDPVSVDTFSFFRPLPAESAMYQQGRAGQTEKMSLFRSFHDAVGPTAYTFLLVIVMCLTLAYHIKPISFAPAAKIAGPHT